MLNFKKKIQEIMKEIDENISNEKEREFVNKKIVELSMLHIDFVNDMNEAIKNKMDLLENNQIEIQNKIDRIQTSIAGIENDIYEEGFDFEIVCPYCNNEFTADI